MTTKQAIEKAIEGGYIHSSYNLEAVLADGMEFGLIEELVLDSSFWQYLGKAKGWGEGMMAVSEYDGVSKNPIYVQRDKFPVWIINWHRLIDHLSEGGTIEKYFQELD